MSVHRELGHGFLEAVYQEALMREFEALHIPYQREMELPISYRGMKLSVTYRADFICYQTTIVEIKALNQLTGKEESQVINYLKATGLQKALLINFGTRSLEQKRLILTKR